MRETFKTAVPSGKMTELLNEVKKFKTFLSHDLNDVGKVEIGRNMDGDIFMMHDQSGFSQYGKAIIPLGQNPTNLGRRLIEGFISTYSR